MSAIDSLRDLRAFELAALAGLPLSVAQLAILKAFEGAPLDKQELRMFRQLVGSRFAKPNPAGYSRLAAQCGRQAGKTRHLDAPLVMRHALRTVPRSPGETLHIPCVGPTREHVATLVDAVAALAGALRVPHERLTGEVRFPALGVVVSVRTANSIAGRSVRSLAVVVDEAAFIGGDTESASINDAEVVAALAPGLVTTGGPILLTSTPWASRGYFHETVDAHHGKARQGETLAIIAPTWTLNPTATKERTRTLSVDERRWRREFGAEALDPTASAFDPELVRGAVRVGDSGADPEPGITYSAGYDHSLGKSDARVLALGWREEQPRDYGIAERFHVARLVVWPAGYDSDRQLAELATWCRRYRVSRLPCDHYDFPTVQAALRRYAIVAEKRSPSVAEREADHEFALSLFETQRITIPADTALVRELTEDLIVERMPGGRSRVRARNTKGRHDDRFDALSRMLAYARSAPASGGGITYETTVQRQDGHVTLGTRAFRTVVDPRTGNAHRLPCAMPLTTRMGRDQARERRSKGIYDPTVDLDASGNVIPIPPDDEPLFNIPVLTSR